MEEIQNLAKRSSSNTSLTLLYNPWWILSKLKNQTTKGQLISKGLLAIFIWTKKQTKFFSISDLKIWYFPGFKPHSRKMIFSLNYDLKWGFSDIFIFLPWRYNTFVGSSLTRGYTFFLKSDLRWAFLDILIHFSFFIFEL